MKVRVVLTGRSYHTAEKLPDELDLPDAASVDDAIESVAGLLGEEDALPPSCLIAVAGDHLGTVANHENRPLREGDEVTLIAPVAGG